MSTRISPKGNTPPASANVLRRGARRPINDGIFGVTIKDSPFNPLIDYNATREKFSLFFEHDSLSRNCSYFLFKGLDNDRHLIPYNINRMLYTRGALMAFNFNGRKELLPFVISGSDGLDYYGLPKRVKPVAYAQNARLLLDREYTVGVDCALWLDVVPFQPTFSPVSRSVYNSIINNEKTECLARVKMSMIAHFEKHVIKVENQTTANKIRNAFRLALENGDPVAVVTDFFETQKEVFDGMTYVGAEFMQTLRDFGSLQDSYNGILTSGFGNEKKERLVSGEMCGITEQVDLMADLRRRMAKLFARDARELLGWEDFDVETLHYLEKEKAEQKEKEQMKLENSGSEPSVGGNKNV
jgi:hypothetical protein